MYSFYALPAADCIYAPASGGFPVGLYTLLNSPTSCKFCGLKMESMFAGYFLQAFNHGCLVFVISNIGVWEKFTRHRCCNILRNCDENVVQKCQMARWRIHDIKKAPRGAFLKQENRICCAECSCHFTLVRGQQIIGIYLPVGAGFFGIG